PSSRAGICPGQADRVRLPAAGLRHHPYRGGRRTVPVLLPQEGAHRGVVLGAAAERRDLQLPDGQVGERMAPRRFAAVLVMTRPHADVSAILGSMGTMFGEVDR